LDQVLPVEFCEKMAKPVQWLNWVERMESDDKKKEIFRWHLRRPFTSAVG